MFKNIFWDVLGKFGVQIVSFAISIVLARLLSPQEYGLMAMAMVVVTFAHVFLDMGFNRAIIQHPEVTQEQYTTIFYVNTGIAGLLTILCYFLAAPLARFYAQPLIRPVFQVVSLSFLLNGLNLVPSAILYRKLHFKANSLQTLASALISGTLGIVMAYRGYGVWSLVVQSLCGSLLLVVFNFAYTRWLPSLTFRLESIRPLWKYGSRLFASGLLDTLYSRLDTFIIAKLFNPSTLGFYSRAQGVDNLVRQFSANSIMGALFPYIAKHQADKAYLKELYTKYLHIILFVSIGMSGVLFLIAKDLFTVMFTARWTYAAELFQLMAVAGFVWPVSCLMCNVIAGVGNSAAFLRLEVYKKLLLLPVYVFGFLFGLKGFLLCMIAVGFGSVALNGFFVSKEIATSMGQQLQIVLYYFLLGALAATLTYFLCRYLPIDSPILMIAAMSSGFSVFYLAGVYLARLQGLEIVTLSFKRVKMAFR